MISLRLPVGIFLSLFEQAFGQAGRFQSRLAIQLLNELPLRFLSRQAGHPLKGLAMLLQRLRAGRVLLYQCLFALEQVLLTLERFLIPLLKQAELAIESLFPLGHTPFRIGNFGKLGLLFLFEFDSCLKDQILGLQLGLFDEILCFTLSRLNDLRRLILGLGTTSQRRPTAKDLIQPGTQDRSH
jgi:hypothetical protein